MEKLNKEKNDIQTEVQKAAQKVTQLAEKVSKEESRYNDYGNLITALKISERKQGYGGKLLTGGLNLVAAGGGAALLAATLGAGAVAGPVGWVLSGVALVGILSYAAGMYIKRKIRDSNVKRMTEEITMVDNYIAGTYVPGNDLLPPGYQIGGDVAAREGNLWHRKMFPTQEKKGWFNKLISKSKSGTKSMKARSDELKEYLGKHSDIGTKGQVAATGFINVLRPNSPEGDQTVSNPAYDPSKPKHETKNPENVTLRKLNEGLLIYFFGDKKDEMVQSLLADDSTDEGSKKVAAAKKLLLQKLKLGD